MTSKEIAKIIRDNFRAEHDALAETIAKQDGDARKYRDEYYFNAGKEWAWNDVAYAFGVELYDDDLELIKE